MRKRLASSAAYRATALSARAVAFSLAMTSVNLDWDRAGHLRVRHAGPNAAELAAQPRTTSACSFAPTLQFAWASATVLNVRCLSEVRRW